MRTHMEGRSRSSQHLFEEQQKHCILDLQAEANERHTTRVVEANDLL